MNKYTKVILIIISLIIIGIIISLFFRKKHNTVNNKEPYKAILNKKLITVEDAILIDNSTLILEEELPKELQDYRTIDTSIVKHIVVSKGTTIVFTKAIRKRNWVSGHTFSYLIGAVNVDGFNYKIIYNWGNLRVICIEEPCNYWEYRKAPWQKTLDTKKYYD